VILDTLLPHLLALSPVVLSIAAILWMRRRTRRRKEWLKGRKP
jgi:hypothetical protein